MTSLDRLKGVVAPELIARAERVSRLLTELGVPHSLIGGLAVGAHGHVRATRDIDFLVGDQAFATLEPILTFRDELRDLVRIGHTDLMSVPSGHPQLHEELSSHPGPPVISLSALILLNWKPDVPGTPKMFDSSWRCIVRLFARFAIISRGMRRNWCTVSPR